MSIKTTLRDEVELPWLTTTTALLAPFPPNPAGHHRVPGCRVQAEQGAAVLGKAPLCAVVKWKTLSGTGPARVDDDDVTPLAPRGRPRPGPTTVGASSAPGSRHRAGSTDSDDSEVMAAGPIMATLTGGGSSSDGGRAASASCSCSNAVGAVPLPDSDYDPRVRFVVTADSFFGTVGEDETRPRLKLRCGRAASGERGASTFQRWCCLTIS